MTVILEARYDEAEAIGVPPAHTIPETFRTPDGQTVVVDLGIDAAEDRTIDGQPVRLIGEARVLAVVIEADSYQHAAVLLKNVVQRFELLPWARV